MRVSFITCFLFFAFVSLGQDIKQDIDLLLNEAYSENRMNNQKSEFQGIFKVYQTHFSEQIINDCIYEHSCSTFSQGAIKEWGLIKGGLLTLDRLMRCNRAAGLDFVPSYFNEKGRIKDHWSDYHLD